MRKKKIKRIKKQKTPFEKEQSFIKISTNILLVIVIIVAIVVSFKNSFGGLNFSGSNTSSLTALSALSEKTDTSSLITNQLSDSNKPALIDKIKSSGLDILSNDEFDYEKYALDSINLQSDLTLSASDVGLIYSYLFVNNTDKYNTILYEISITRSDDTITIKTVASINFYNAFTSKLSSTYNSETTNSIPKRVYVSNSATYKDGQYTYAQVLYNNLSENESKEISTLVDNANDKAKLNEYVPNLIITMINNLSSKTGTTLILDNNQITLKKDA